MIGFVSMFIAYLAMVAKELAARSALLVVVIGVVTSVIVVTKLIMEGLIGAVPYLDLPPDALAALGAIMPSNTRVCLELLFEARVALLVFQSKWLYLRMYMWAMNWKFI